MIKIKDREYEVCELKDLIKWEGNFGYVENSLGKRIFFKNEKILEFFEKGKVFTLYGYYFSNCKELKYIRDNYAARAEESAAFDDFFNNEMFK